MGLTREKLLEIIKDVEKTLDVTILNVNERTLDSKGKNITGDIKFCDITATVKEETKVYHWAIKMPPVESRAGMMVFHRSLKLEEKEITFYRKIIPAWKKLIFERNAEIGLNLSESPYAEFHEDPKKGSILVMENLNQFGFTGDFVTTNALDLRQTELALEELAKFHTLGYVYLHSHPDGVEGGLKEYKIIMNDYWVNNPENQTETSFAETIFNSRLPGVLTLAKEVQGEGQEFEKMLAKLFEKRSAFEIMKSLSMPQEDEFNTLCHGDTHLLNLLFKYEGSDDAKVPTAAAWVDLAVTLYASPCHDLAYFFYTSTRPALRQKHLPHLLEHYHKALTEILTKLKVDPAVYSFRQLLHDFDKYSMKGFLVSLTLVPYFFVKKEDQIDPSQTLNVDWSDNEQLLAMMTEIQGKMKQGLSKAPLVKEIIVGNFLDMIERGHLKL